MSYYYYVSVGFGSQVFFLVTIIIIVCPQSYSCQFLLFFPNAIFGSQSEFLMAEINPVRLYIYP